VRKVAGTLSRKLVAWGVVLTWAVGGVVGLEGYRLIALTVHREAEARVGDAVRVARRLIEAEFDSMAPGDEGVVRVATDELAGVPVLASLARSARDRGGAHGFVLLERGLCIAAARRDGASGDVTVTVRPLRGENRLPDRIRDIVFGSVGEGRAISATLTIFERDVRIATNVVTARGERAVGTRASSVVAHRVLDEGLPWNDRARVLDRWTIASYQPVRSVQGDVVGMLYAGLDEAPYVAEGHRNIVLFLTSIGVLTLLVTGLVWWFGRRITRPLTELTSAASALASGAPRPIEVDASDPEEIRALGDTFNRMADQIQLRTNDLEASREEARKALDDYLEVLGFVAHELKSPLASAKMQLQLIDGGFTGAVPEPMKRPLAGLRRAVDYGSEVAQSFNQLSRAEGEGFAARPRDVADFVAEVVRPAVADIEGAAAARGMTFAIEGGSDAARADTDLMRVVMDNLVGNAVKYGREGTTIRIAVRRAGGRLRVEVRNKGVGVSPENIPRLFGKFYRVHDPATTTTKGTGVGLYLVRRFVGLHGGSVGVEGEYGSWISFWFEIPSPEA